MKVARRVGLASVGGLLLLAGCGRAATPMAPSGVARATTVAASAVPNQLIVKFRTDRGRQALLQELGPRYGLKAIKRIARVDALVCACTDHQGALAALAKHPDVLYAEPNWRARATGMAGGRGMQAPVIGAGDELLKDLWGMAKINAAAGWARGGGKGATVAVVDTGVDYRHPDLAGRVDKGRDFANDDDDAMDDQGHGTHVAGTIGAGLGNGGVVGVAPNVSIVAVKVLGGDGSGSYEGVASGIVYAADRGVDVISMSLGGPAGAKVIEDAVKYAQDKGVLVVAAMGNENTASPSYPAAVPGVLAVGATTSADKRSSFSNFGKHIAVAAPGSDILSSVPGGKYDTYSGTSMATPHVSGLAAVVKAAYPQLDAGGLRARIEKGTVDLGAGGFDPYFGHGRIDVARTLAD